MNISLLTALRQTIATSTTPLIETIQSVVSNMQSITTPELSKTETTVGSVHDTDTEAIQTMALHLQADEREVQSTSNVEQVESVSNESISTEDTIVTYIYYCR